MASDGACGFAVEHSRSRRDWRAPAPLFARKCQLNDARTLFSEASTQALKKRRSQPPTHLQNIDGWMHTERPQGVDEASAQDFKEARWLGEASPPLVS